MRPLRLARSGLPIWLAVLLLVPGPILGAQGPAAPRPASDTAAPRPTLRPDSSAPVVVGGDTLFRIRTRLGPFSPRERAAATTARIQGLARDPFRTIPPLRVLHGPQASDVTAGPLVLLSVTDADARAEGVPRNTLAHEHAVVIARSLRVHGFAAQTRTIGVGVLLALLTAIATVLVFRFVNRVFPRLLELIERGRTGWLPSIRVQRVELVSADHIADGLIWLTKVVRMVVLALLLYVSIPVILSFFPWTRPYAGLLLDYVVTPFANIWAALIAYLPNVFKIGAIVLVTAYFLKLLKPIFTGLARGNITLSGFYPDWAMPTYKILRALVIIFAFIAAWPYLPGSDSEAFRGVGVFMGLLISLGSASAVGNMIGGVLLTYMRPFRVGDRVKIADTEGDVTERSLLVTRIRTTKNVDITVPNALVLGAHIVNYSSSAKAHGLILNTTITIGYDAPWRRVQELLIAAALATPDIEPEPPPFVLQTALNDFYVSYQLNAFTRAPNRMAATYSALHAAIQDRFNEAGVEIMSPHYAAARDGGHVAIPAEYLPADYRAPGMRVEVDGVGEGERVNG